MRLYKAEYKDRDGKQQKAVKWYINFAVHNQIRRRLPAFADKRLSETLGRNIESLINCRIAGLEPDVKLNQWIETMPENLLKKFVSWGLIEGQRTEITKPLTQHISEYVKVLDAKGFTKDYITRCRNRLKKIIADCRFIYFRDITKSAVEMYSGKLKKDGYGKTSRGHYISALQTFLNWAESDQRIMKNPIAKIEKPARDSEEKGVLTPEQFVHLIKTTFEKNILIGRISGQERALLYFLAGATGIRRKELLNLVWSDINLSDNPFVCVRASIAKNGQKAEQPIPPILVSLLVALKVEIKPKDNDRVFLSFGKSINTAELIRTDLTAAEIPLIDREGNEICFHSLRNSYISYLANSSTPAKVVQKLARHSDPRLTFNTYARTFGESEKEAVSFLPNFGNFVFATGFAKQNVFSCSDKDCLGQQNLIGDEKTVLLGQEKLPPRGIEPLLPG